MWVEKQKNGNFKFVEQYIDPNKKGRNKYRRISVTFDRKTNRTIKEAERLLAEKKAEKMAEFESGVVKEMTFEEVMCEWEKLWENNVSDGSIKTWKNCQKPRIRKEIDTSRLITSFSEKEISILLEKMLYKENFSNSFVGAIKSKLNAIFKHAYKYNYLSNPLNFTLLDVQWKKTRTSIEKKYLDDDELEKVLAFMYRRNRIVGLACELQVLTGLRIGELLALRKRDIVNDDDKYYLDINGTMVKREDGATVRQNFTKTPDSMRKIVLNKRATEICMALPVYNSDGDYLFAGKFGKPISYSLIGHYFAQCRKEVDIDKDLVSHTLRHTHVSKLAELGIPLYVISKRVGHHDAKTTSNIYLHVTKKAEGKYNDIISKL